MKNQLNNKPELKPIRKELRNNATPAEATLWKCLQRRQLGGFKFRRQHSIDHYILDFYCPEKKLGVELDGSPHYTIEGHESDQNRDLYLKQIGIKVLRFENKLVYKNQSQVLDTIQAALENK